MDTAFASIVTAKPVTVLGRKLEPFSLGHCFLLEVCGSEVLTGDLSTVSLDELHFASWICSKPFEDAKAELRTLLDGSVEGSRKIYKRLRAEGKQHGEGLADFQKDRQAMSDYLGQYLTAPERWEDGDRSELRTPWQVSVVTALMRHLSIAETNAWNMPVNAALCLYASVGEQLGDDSLVSDSERAIRERLEGLEGDS